MVKTTAVFFPKTCQPWADQTPKIHQVAAIEKQVTKWLPWSTGWSTGQCPRRVAQDGLPKLDGMNVAWLSHAIAIQT